MSIARTRTFAFLGTDETTLSSSIANNASLASSETDVLGNDTSVGGMHFYLNLTSTVTAGSCDVYVEPQRTTSTSYTKTNPDFSVAPTNGTQHLYLGYIASIDRYVTVNVKNNATGASFTCSVLGVLEQLS